MAAWLTKVIDALAGAGETRLFPRQVLLAAQRERLKIALELLNPASIHGAVLTTTIEQVRLDDVVISQPSIGGLTHPLTFGEDLRMSFHNKSMHYSAQTRCLGRVKIPAGGSQLLFAYRLEMPATMRSDDRRRHPRIDLPLDLSCEAQLYAPACDGPVLGTMIDISMSGAQVRTAMAADKIQPGQEIYLKSLLPEPVGLLDELVQVARLEDDADNGGAIIGVAFKRRIQGLAELIRSAQARQMRRSEAC